MGGSDHCYFYGCSSDSNSNDVELVETRTVHFARLKSSRFERI